MCQQLDITRAAYYKWLHRKIPEAEQENILIAQLIREYDDRFNHILGYRRMALYINRLNNKHYSRNRVHRIMKAIHIHSVIRRKRKKYQSSAPEATAENILNRDFYAKAPNEKWATDITEFKWYEGPVVHKLYLSAILDLYDLFPIAWVVSKRNDSKLVLDTFAKAMLTRQQPPGQLPPKSAQVCLQTGNNIQIQLFSEGTNPKLTPIEGFRPSVLGQKVRKTPDFFRNPVFFMVAEAGLEPTTSGL
ncbi:MAG: IS3 family transposase [Oscillospiraceae bacterium]|nr:IS3 family transposase [Oscillospiraceae bacterium]